MKQTLIPTPWERLFIQKLQTVEKSLKVACPFIKARYAKLLLSSLPRKSDLEIRIITRLKPSDMIAGASDLESLKLFCAAETLLPIRVRYLNQLHAKVFIFDRAEAIVTSTNLTYSGFNINAELGVSLTMQDSIAECETHFEYLWNKSADVTLSELLSLESEICLRRVVVQREQFLDRLESSDKQAEERTAFIHALENSTAPETVEICAPAHEEFLEPDTSNAISTAKETERKESILATQDSESRLQELVATFRQVFNRNLNRHDALTIFVHASAAAPCEADPNRLALDKKRSLLVGFYARELLILKHILSSSRETLVTGEIIAKLQYIKATNWYARTLQRLGLGVPIVGKGLARDIGDPKVASRLANDILLTSFGWFVLNEGFESLLAVNDAFFDFTDAFPFDILTTLRHKTKLQEYTQQRFGTLPTYSVKSQEGSENMRLFIVAVQLPNGRSYEGSGSSIKLAEKEAAKTALNALGKEGLKLSNQFPVEKAVRLQSADLDLGEIAKLKRFWRICIEPLVTAPFDLRFAAVVNASAMRLRGFVEQRLRQRYSCYGSMVLNSFAAVKLAKVWEWGSSVSISRGDFMPSLCAQKQLTKVHDVLGIGAFALLNRAEREVSPAGKQDTIQAILGYLFITFGEHKALRFFEDVAVCALGSQHIAGIVSHNFKGELQEHVQRAIRNSKSPIEYRTREHQVQGKAVYETQVWIAGGAFEIGQGRTKIEAENYAAEKTLQTEQFKQFLTQNNSVNASQ